MIPRMLLRSLPLALVITACTPLLPTPEPVTTAQQHELRPDALPLERAPMDGAPVLAVVAVSAGPLLDGRNMLYRDGAGQTAVFAVVAPGGRGQASLLLDAELLTLHLDSEPSPGTLQLEVRLQLITGRSREVVATTRLRETEPLEASGPRAMAAASGRALARLLDASTTFVRDAVALRAGTTGRG